MTHPLTPREKVEPSLDDLLRKAVEAMKSWTPEQREAHSEAQKKAWVAAEMAFGDEGTRVVTALASGSGDHSGGVTDMIDPAELAALREHRITADLLVSTLKADKAEAERKLAEAVATLKEIAEIEPQPFDGGLDVAAIRTCDECQRYAGHPVQRGICNTHRRPIWDREKHESREEKSLGYRAKSIARTFLSKEAERG